MCLRDTFNSLLLPLNPDSNVQNIMCKIHSQNHLCSNFYRSYMFKVQYTFIWLVSDILILSSVARGNLYQI